MKIKRLFEEAGEYDPDSEYDPIGSNPNDNAKKKEITSKELESEIESNLRKNDYTDENFTNDVKSLIKLYGSGK